MVFISITPKDRIDWWDDVTRDRYLMKSGWQAILRCAGALKAKEQAAGKANVSGKTNNRSAWYPVTVLGR